jgi:IS5 family transposase
MPSKPGYEPLSQANPSRHPEVAGYQPDLAARLASCLHSGTADRNYGEPATDRDLEALGGPHGHHPARSQGLVNGPGAPNSAGFRRLDKWHTGSEGRISYLKRRYGWDRTRLDGRGGAAIWCAHGDFARNLVKLSALAS